MARSASSSLHDESFVNPFKRGTTQRFTFRLREDFPLAVKSAHWSTSVCVQMSKVSSFVRFAEALIGQRLEPRIYLDKTEAVEINVVNNCVMSEGDN